MPEINDLTPIAPADVTDDDLLVIWDTSAPAGSEAKRVTRAQFLDGAVRSGQNATLSDVDADELNAPVGAIDTLTVSVGLNMGATISDLVLWSGSVTIATLASLATQPQTVTVPGALVGDFVILQAPSSLPAGLILTAAVSGANTMQIRAVNATGASIAGAAYTLSVLLIRAS